MFLYLHSVGVWLILLYALISFHTAGHDVNLDYPSTFPSLLFSGASLGAEVTVMFARYFCLNKTIKSFFFLKKAVPLKGVITHL